MLVEQTSNIIFKILENIEYGSLTIEKPCGSILTFQGKKPGTKASLKIHDLKTLKNLMLKGDIGLAADYQSKLWDSNSIADLIEFGIQNEKCLKKLIFGGRLQQISSILGYLSKINTRKGSKKNIFAHYDIGNNFYSIWLDPSMTYSSGIFKSESDDLFTSQMNKYDNIISKLSDPEIKHVLEVGCGWGGFMHRYHSQTGKNITGITISRSQFEYAQEKLQNLPVDLDLIDYRDVIGKYDAIVSIEMFEAVGEKYWKTYFSKIKDLLSENGTAIIQTITIGDAYFAEYRRSGDAIRSYIFPGGMLASPTIFKLTAESLGLKVEEEQYFGKDYAKTLSIWLNNFDANIAKVRELGLDDSFIRMWRFYLGYCIGAFNSGRTDVMQITLKHA